MKVKPKNPYELPIEFILLAGLLTALLSLGNTLVFRMSSSLPLKDKIPDSYIYAAIICVFTTCFLLVTIMRRRMLADIESYHEKLSLSRMYEERFRLTIDNAPVGMAMVDLDGSILRANQALSEMFQYSPEELISRKLTELQVSNKTGEDDPLLEQLMSNTIPKYYSSKEYFRKDGTVVETIQHMSVVHDTNGNPLHVIAQVEDVTEKNRIRRALDAERELLSVTLESIQEGVISVDIDGIILLTNDTAKSLLDINGENIVGKHLSEITDTMDEKMQRLWKTTLDSVLMENRTAHFSGGIKIPSEDHSTERILEGCAAPTHDKHGSAIGAVVVLRDITEQVRAEEQIRYLSLHDKLTGLYNRAFFEDALFSVDTGEQLPISLIMGDVNGLKLVNDAFGHQRGDELLKRIAGIIQSNCRKDDVVARWGGDEFTVILPQTPRQVADEICARIRKACSNTKEGPIQPSIALGCQTKEKPGQDIRKTLKDAEDRMYNKKLVESKSARSAIISSLRKTLEERTCDTEEHGVRLQNLALAFGRTLMLSNSDLDKLTLLAVLHDIGKVAVPDAILMKSTSLTCEEWTIMKKHPETGYRIAHASGNLANIADEILSHHEWWDGTGYPNELRGDEIPYLSRIIAIVDAYDTMVQGRHYEKPVSQEKALDELRRYSGIQFDPDLTQAFIDFTTVNEMYSEIEAGGYLKTSPPR